MNLKQVTHKPYVKMVVKDNTRAISSVEMSKKFNKNYKQKQVNGVKPRLEETDNVDLSETSAERSQIFLVEQELKFARALAGNDVAVRKKQLNKLKKWLVTRSSSSYPFSDQDFLRIWKGLFFCMWMSDKPLVQEQLAEDLAALIHCFSTPVVGIQFFGTFLESMCAEWFGLDNWRMDKFLMLVRRVTRQMLVLLKKHDWDVELIKELRIKLNQTLLSGVPNNYCGLIMHFSDLYLEEIAKISNGDIPRARVTFLIKPFAVYLATAQDYRATSDITQNIFFHLIKQSDMGREYQEKYEIWKMAGCPTRSVDDIEIHEKFVKDEENDEEDEGEEAELSESGTELDPRAGLVSVVVPEIDFKPDHIIQIMEKIMYKAEVKKRNRQILQKIVRVYQRYLQGIYPFTERGFPDISKIKAGLPKIQDKIKELDDFEKETYSETRQFKKIYKSLKRYKDPMKRVEKAQKICNKLMNGGGQQNKESEENIEVTQSKKKANLWIEEDATDNSVTDKTKKPQKRKQTDKSDPEIVGKSLKKAKKMQPQVENELVVQSAEISTTEVVKSKKQKRASLPMPEIEFGTPSPTKKKNKLKVIDEEDDGTTPAMKKTPTNKLNNLKIEKTATPKSVVKKTPVAKHDKNKDTFNVDDDWSKPLEDGEVEMFLPSRKTKLREINNELNNSAAETEILLTPNNKNLLLNPFAKVGSAKMTSTTSSGKLKGKQRLSLDSQTLLTASGQKRVKIALHKNMEQKTEEYLIQLKSSPQLPYDSNKKPTKSLLKPNLMPSPINPFFKKKIGLNFDSMA